MKCSKPFLLGVATFGWLICLAVAAEPAPEIAAPAVADAGCECCPPGRGGLIGGVGVYIMQPYFESNLAYNVIVQNTNPQAQVVSRVDVHPHMEVAPLMWLGYMNECGLGGRARYWYFRQGTSETLSLPPNAGGPLFTFSSATPLGLQTFGDTVSDMFGPEATSFNITTKLEVQVADLEAMQDIQAGRFDFLLSGGLRLVRIDQSYNAFDAQSTSPLELRSLLSSYRFQGAGPVCAVEARRPLGGQSLALFGSARGAMVFGAAQQDGAFGGPLLRNNDPNPQLATQHFNRVLPIGEMELGLEYDRSVGRSQLFGQLALVGQNWFGAGNASRSASTTSPGGVPVFGGAPVDSDFAFFGLAVRIGVNY